MTIMSFLPIYTFEIQFFRLYFCCLQEAKRARLQRFEIPAKIKLLSEPWTPESGLVTGAFKIKRDVIRKTFSENLSTLYTS